MNTKVIATSMLVSLALMGSAQAAAQTPRGDIDNEPFQGVFGQTYSSVTRAQIRAELHHAKNAGLVVFGDTNNAPFTAQIDRDVTGVQVADETTHGLHSSPLVD